VERVRERIPPGGHPLTYAEAAERLGAAGRGYLARLDDAVSADLNTAEALVVLTRLSRDPELTTDDLAVLVAAAEALLAMGLLDLVPGDLDAPAAEVALDPDDIERLLDERAAARRRGDFAAADGIRDRLDRIGIELRDTPGGTVWKTRAAAAGQRPHDQP
jgi:cysteinyl-tRNA synthetase